MVAVAKVFLLLGVAATASRLRQPAQTEVQSLHAQLQKMSGGLEAMEKSFASSSIGAEMHTFLGELHTVLKDTENMKNTTLAMQKLTAAKQSLAGLTKDLTTRQESLMKDGESEKESLLLGVLMTKQKDTFAKQLEVLQTADFADLAVAKALVAQHDEKTALFAQAAEYMDKHSSKEHTKDLIGKATEHVEAEKKAQDIAKSFEQRVATLEKAYADKEKRHNDRAKELQNDVNKASKRTRKFLEGALKKENRAFKKWSVQEKNQINTMKSAADAIRKGDMKALNKARDALQQSMKSLQSKNSGFLVLIDLGHKLMEKDCPYCAAQCVEKCHNGGKSYMGCMTDCADAGKQ